MAVSFWMGLSKNCNNLSLPLSNNVAFKVDAYLNGELSWSGDGWLLHGATELIHVCYYVFKIAEHLEQFSIEIEISFQYTESFHEQKHL